MKKSIYLLLSSLVSFISFTAHAGLSLSDLQGQTRYTYQSPRGIAELCVVPKHWPGGVYKKDDAEKEKTLCGYDFHRNMGICPKYTSTNPAILLLEPTAKFSKEAIDASDCNYKAMDLKNEAKFKQSISCSYTPAILAYYHVSRALGEVHRIPVNVIRTMDIRVHADLTLKANEHLRDSKELIKTIWGQFAKAHQNPQNYPLLYDNTQTQIFGALIDNIKKEEQYIEVSGRGGYETRYERFLQQPPFLKLMNPATVTQQLGTSAFTDVAQTVLQLKDVSDMVILDHLLNQQDRIGNIHFKLFWYYIDPTSNSLGRKKSEARIEKGQLIIPDQELKAMQGRQAVLLKEMVLKDNDCGIVKRNMMKEIGALNKINHVSYHTYRRLLQFEKDLSTQPGKNYFKQELLFTDVDLSLLMRNAQEIKNILVAKCQQGSLQFDLDLENYVPGMKVPARECL